ncbi:MMPL family transporter [Actinomyces slackii]|uniref:Membrane protein ydgH n=1 Tax=Actinomyces slackii TaxID=52774 RepID=A0A3S4TBA9_9ACTO|nr:MMPL family transporter [Actinomyces slackii]VEG73967.1 Putative membrane protein ydgH [Actinomyces slackii]
MSSLLHRLGRWCAGHAGRVLAAWFLLIALLGGAVSAVGMHLSDSFAISGTESMDGLEVLEERLPQAAGTSEQVLFTASDGQIENHREAIEGFVQQVSGLDGVALVSSPFGDQDTGAPSTVSRDGAHVLVQIQADSSVGSITSGTTDRATELSRDLEDLAQDAQETDPALRVQLGGNIGQNVGIGISATELIGVVIAAVVLFITFGSFLAAGAPILAALIGVGSGMLGILLTAAVVDINSTTPVLAVMIGLAVGIDYALFILSRAREYLAEGIAPIEAAGRATATSGSAVVFAGITVIVALCGLSVARIGFLTTMGLASVAVVAVSVLVALTVVPALIGLIGTRLMPRLPRSSRRDARARRGRSSGPAARWVRVATRRPWLTISAVVVLLGLCAVPITGLRLALTDNGFEAEGTQRRQTYDAISEAYGEGYNSPIIVIADITNTSDPRKAVDELAQEVSSLDGVEEVALATPNEDGTLAFIQIRPEKSQADPGTMDLVREIRDRAGDYERAHGVTDIMVTGQTAVAIDVAESLNASLLPFGIVVVGLSLFLLMIVFRSVAVPVTATLGYLLSLAAGMGAVGAVFGWGWAADLLAVTRVGAVISFLPVIVMGVLFGLAMDYEVFLVSRMREEWIRRRPADSASPEQRRRAAVEAVESGFTGSATVVGAAAVIMIGVFAAFIHTDNVYVKPIALGLSVGIVADAFLVRMTLVPAIMAALGDRAWWLPAWLDRQLPVIDVEGEGLSRTLEHEEWSASYGRAVVRAEGLRLADAEGTVIEGLDLVLRPGEIGLLRAPSLLARRALAAALGGRLRPADGLLVVDDHVLPDGTASIQSVTTSLRHWDQDVPEHVRLVVVDDPGKRRWRRIHDLASSGMAVLVTLAEGAALDMPESDHPSVGSDRGPWPAVVVDIDTAGRATTLTGPSQPRRPVQEQSQCPHDPGVSTDTPPDASTDQTHGSEVRA